MVFYFSGTGNSKWAANELANRLGEEVASIVDLTRAGGETLRFGASDTVGLVFPVYAGSPPEIVMDFIKRIETGGAYTFAVCTCAGGAGCTLTSLSCKLHIDSGFSVILPNNFVCGTDVETPEQIGAKIAAASERMSEISDTIKNRQSSFKPASGGMVLLSALVSWGFNRFARSTRSFSVGDGCIGCGMCEKLCSAATIVMENGKPRWGRRCYMCMSCINRCPQRAIEYGNATKTRGRYCFPTDDM